MRSYTVKENHIGLAVSEILQYKQKDILLLYYYFIKKNIMYQNQYFVILCYFDLQNFNSLAVAINLFLCVEWWDTCENEG